MYPIWPFFLMVPMISLMDLTIGRALTDLTIGRAFMDLTIDRAFMDLTIDRDAKFDITVFYQFHCI